MSGLVELGRYSDATLAHILRGRLQAADIDAVCFDAGMNSAESAPGVLNVRLMVLAEDLADARAVLAEAEPVDDSPEDYSDLRRRRQRLILWGVGLLVASTVFAPIVVGLMD